MSSIEKTEVYVETPEQDKISRALTEIIRKELAKKLEQEVDFSLVLHSFNITANTVANAEARISITCDKDLLGKFKAFVGITEVPFINSIVVSPVVSSVVRGKIKKATKTKVDFNLQDLKTECQDNIFNIDSKATAFVSSKELEHLLQFIKGKIGADFPLEINNLSLVLNNGALDMSVNTNATIDADTIDTLYNKYVSKETKN